MLKKIVFFAFIALPVMTFAQESQKIAYIDQEDVIYSMPEYLQMIDSLRRADAEFQAEFKVLQDEYTKKVTDYVAKRDTLNESIKAFREQELQDLEQRAQNYQQYVGQRQEEAQQTLIIPVQVKFQKAIDDVATENNFLYVISKTAIFYSSPNATNATPLVKRKLGIQ